jgi:hypothetical protein
MVPCGLGGQAHTAVRRTVFGVMRAIARDQPRVMQQAAQDGGLLGVRDPLPDNPLHEPERDDQRDLCTHAR